ncbi:hypothetical protein GCM10009795_077950 [Nocardioides hankookensis]
MIVKVNVFYRTDSNLPVVREYDISGYEFLDFDDKISAVADVISFDPEFMGKIDVTFQIFS